MHLKIIFFCFIFLFSNFWSKRGIQCRNSYYSQIFSKYHNNTMYKNCLKFEFWSSKTLKAIFSVWPNVTCVVLRGDPRNSRYLIDNFFFFDQLVLDFCTKTDHWPWFFCWDHLKLPVVSIRFVLTGDHFFWDHPKLPVSIPFVLTDNFILTWTTMRY